MNCVIMELKEKMLYVLENYIIQDIVHSERLDNDHSLIPGESKGVLLHLMTTLARLSLNTVFGEQQICEEQ